MFSLVISPDNFVYVNGLSLITRHYLLLFSLHSDCIFHLKYLRMTTATVIVFFCFSSLLKCQLYLMQTRLLFLVPKIRQSVRQLETKVLILLPLSFCLLVYFSRLLTWMHLGYDVSLSSYQAVCVASHHS